MMNDVYEIACRDLREIVQIILRKDLKGQEGN
jgi:hypothetical protein